MKICIRDIYMKAGLFKNIDGTLKADYRWVNYLNLHRFFSDEDRAA